MQEVVGPELDAARDVRHALERARDDDGHVLHRWLERAALHQVEAVHVGHLEVEQHQVEALGAQLLERHAAAVGARHVVTEEIEHARQHQPVDLVVVHHQQARAARASCRRFPLARIVRAADRGPVRVRDVGIGGDTRGRGGQRELVAASGDGGNGLRTEHLAKRRHLHLQVVLLHHEARPHDTDQLVGGHDAIAPRRQRQQQVEGAAAQRHDLAVDLQSALLGANLEPAESAACRSQGLVAQRRAPRRRTVGAPRALAIERTGPLTAAPGPATPRSRPRIPPPARRPQRHPAGARRARACAPSRPCAWRRMCCCCS